MPAALRTMRSEFVERMQAPAWWAAIAYSWPRRRVVFLVALLPLLLMPLMAMVAPEALGRAMTEPERVRATYSRLAPAFVSGAAIAVSVAALALSRQLKGVRSVEEHHQHDRELRQRVRESLEAESLPLPLHAFSARSLEAVAEAASRAARAMPRELREVAADDLALASYLENVEDRAAHVGRQLDTAGARPHAMLAAALDFEVDLTAQMARRFRRRVEKRSPELAEALETLHERLMDFLVVRNYVTTLANQWSLSRMSAGVLVSIIPSILVAIGVALTYGAGMRDAVGVVATSLVLGAALGIVLIPVAFFLSFLLRFVFVNQHTLPTSSFVLGPEEPGAIEVARERLRRRTRARGAP